MKEGQTEIYYASGASVEAVNSLPALDQFKTKGYDVLVCTDAVDEFLFNVLDKYDEKSFKNVNAGDLNLLDEEESKKIDEIKESKKDLIDAIKDSLKDNVSDVVLSKRLTDNAVCLTSKNNVSLEMERVLAQQENSFGAKAEKVLEINPNHDVFKAIEAVYDKDPANIGKYAKFLYNNALIVEGMPIEDNLEFSKTMCELFVNANK